MPFSHDYIHCNRSGCLECKIHEQAERLKKLGQERSMTREQRTRVLEKLNEQMQPQPQLQKSPKR